MTRRSDEGEVGLAGDLTEDLDLEQLVSSHAFQIPQEEEREFQAIREAELVKVEEEIVDPGRYMHLP